MQHINLNEFDEFKKKFDDFIEKKNSEQKIQFKKLKNLWIERKKKIPNFKPKILLIYNEDLLKEINKEKDKNLNFKTLKLNQIEYSKKINKINFNVFNNNFNKFYEKKIDSNQKKFVLNKSQSYAENLRLNSKKFIKKINNSNSNLSINNIIKTNDNKKSKKKIEFDKKVRNYLEEKRKMNNNNNISSPNIHNIKIECKNKLKNLSDLNEDNLNIIFSKINNIENQAKNKKELLKFSGGSKNNPILNKEVCELMIGAINSKLKVLEAIDKIE